MYLMFFIYALIPTIPRTRDVLLLSVDVFREIIFRITKARFVTIKHFIHFFPLVISFRFFVSYTDIINELNQTHIFVSGNMKKNYKGMKEKKLSTTNEIFLLTDPFLSF